MEPKLYSFEAAFAGRGLQIVGALLVMLGTAFFLNLAFIHNWIAPGERILLGLVCASVLLVVGARRLRAGGTPVAEGVVGLGAGIAYLSLWASVALFPQLNVSRSAEFCAMISVTGILVLLAARRHNERVALLGLAGGFLTPVLLSSTPPEATILAAYVLMLGASFAALAVRAGFRFVGMAAFAGSAAYAPRFAPLASGWPSTESYAVTTAIFAVFAVAFSIQALRGRDRELHLGLFALDTGLYGVMLAFVFAGQQHALGFALLGLSAAMFAAARFVPVRGLQRTIPLYFGIVCATIALPLLIHHLVLLDALAVEATVLLIAGARYNEQQIAGGGALLFMGAAVWLLFETFMARPSGTAFDSLTLAYVIVIAALVAIRSQLTIRMRDHASLGEAKAALAGIANTLAVVAISRAVLNALGGPFWTTDGVSSQAEAALSVAWSAYATGLFGFGLARRSAICQRCGLLLIALTILKVLAVDLSNVDLAWRVVSFVVLGSVCMVLSAWYLRSQGRPELDKSP
jgi:uncharacterized membrane protein